MDARTGPRRPSPEAVAALKAEAALLHVEEILDLCYAFSADPVRLAVYLDVLRGKGGVRAQAAASLICYDLARHGDERMEREFEALVPVLQELADEMVRAPATALMRELTGGNEYLESLWRELVEKLAGRDLRVEGRLPPELIDDEDVLELDLFTAEDELDIEIDDPDTGIDDEALEEAWQERFARLVVPGFLANDTRDVERIEALRNEAVSFAAGAPTAREMLPLIELFLASHLRARNLLGRRNKARDALLEAALLHFHDVERPPRESVVAWFVEPTAAPHAWDKMAELLLDFVAFLGSPDARLDSTRPPAEALAQGYVRSGRPQPPPTRLAAGPERRRR